MSSPPTVTVLTAAYNRRDLLRRLYRSLEGQTYRDFEWVVVDDGSTDGTEALFEQVAEAAGFPIRYVRQTNGGKHTAINNGLRHARGEYCAICDSDDWYMPDSLERMIRHWERIPPDDRAGFSSVEGKTTRPDGTLLGSPFPEDVFDSDTFDIKHVHGVRGDSRGMHRTEVLRAFPFPGDLGSFITENLVWNRIAAAGYRNRFVNEAFGVADYQPGGLSDSGNSLWVGSPKASLLYFRELLELGKPLPAKLKLRAYANVARYSFHLRRPLGRALRETPSLSLALGSVPIGAALYARDRARGLPGANRLAT